jgi:hypothetical protein
MSQQQPPDNRFFTLRAAGQDATEFSLSDDGVRRYMELRDAGQEADEIARQLFVKPEVVQALIRADESFGVAHRIATGELPMYPAPEPDQRVIDARSGSSAVPIVLLVLLLLGVIVYALVR